MSTLLETRKVSKSFGVLRALQDVSMAVREGELVSVVGPNGAGKTTLVNLLTGLLQPTSGEVLFKGETIAGVGPVELAERGHRLSRALHISEETSVLRSSPFHHLPQIGHGSITEPLLGRVKRKNLLRLCAAGVGENGPRVERREIFRREGDDLGGQAPEVVIGNFEGIHACRI